MSLYGYLSLPKVAEDAAHSSDKTNVMYALGLETPTTTAPPVTSGLRNEEVQTSFCGNSFSEDQENYAATETSASLNSAERPSCSNTSNTYSRFAGDTNTTASQKSMFNTMLQRAGCSSSYVKTPHNSTPTNAYTWTNPEPLAREIQDKLLSGAVRAAQNVPEERLQRKEMKKSNRNPGAVVPLEGVEETSLGLIGKILVILSYVLIVATFPIAIFFCLKVIQEYERAVIFRLGRITKGGAWGPGVCFYIPCLDVVTVVDMRTLSFAVPPQELLTKDSVTVTVDAVVYFRISSPVASVCNVEDVEQCSRLLAQTTLRTILGTKLLKELLSEREAISHDMQTSLDQATDPWGVVVERVEIKDVRLPANLQRAMAAEAEAYREARAKEIAADGERNAAQALKEASDKMMQSPCSIQLRYLQTLTSIAGSGQNSTIIFPVPIDLLNMKLNNVPSQPIYQNVRK